MREALAAAQRSPRLGWVLSLRDLNRTLLLRQHLLERTTMPALAMVEHLVGLQAQDNLPPYLSLAARLDGFDPASCPARSSGPRPCGC